jgi:hypothetical protein
VAPAAIRRFFARIAARASSASSPSCMLWRPPLIAAGQAFTITPANVTLYQASIVQVLGDNGTAIEHAKTLRPAAIPTVERQGRYWINVARAFHHSKDYLLGKATRRRSARPLASPKDSRMDSAA